MNFFLQIHRSIFDLPFYREAPLFGRRAIFFFVIKLVLAAGFISAVAHTIYIFSPSRGAIAAVAVAMKGIEIKDGRLLSDRPLPYEIPPLELNMIFSRIINVPLTADTLQTPRVIIDTSANQPVRTAPGIVMRSSDMAIYSASGIPQIIPYYKKGWYGPVNMQFTEEGTARLLKKVAVWLFIVNLLWDGLCCAALVLFCISMLALAAYIFRIERDREVGYYFSIASYAITPLPIGMVIIALSDVSIPGSWRFLVIMSAVIMFRALIATSKTAKDADSGGKQ